MTERGEKNPTRIHECRAVVATTGADDSGSIDWPLAADAARERLPQPGPLAELLHGCAVVPAHHRRHQAATTPDYARDRAAADGGHPVCSQTWLSPKTGSSVGKQMSMNLNLVILSSEISGPGKRAFW